MMLLLVDQKKVMRRKFIETLKNIRLKKLVGGVGGRPLVGPAGDRTSRWKAPLWQNLFLLQVFLSFTTYNTYPLKAGNSLRKVRTLFHHGKLSCVI